LQRGEEQIFRLERQTVKIAFGPEPNSVDRVGLSSGRGDYTADDEGRASLSGFAGRFVQKVRTMVDHAVVGNRSQNTAVGVAAIHKRHVLRPQRCVTEAIQPPRQSR